MNDVVKPIKAFGSVLLVLSIAGAVFFFFITTPAPFFSPTSPSFSERFLFYFTLVELAFFLVTGLGVVLLKRWGYFLLKVFLYLLFLTFPIGTAISYVTLRYMKKHQIKTYFGFASP